MENGFRNPEQLEVEEGGEGRRRRGLCSFVFSPAVVARAPVSGRSTRPPSTKSDLYLPYSPLYPTRPLARLRVSPSTLITMQHSLLLLLLTATCLTEALMHQRRASSLLQIDKTKKLTHNHNNNAAQQQKATTAKEVPQYGKTVGPDVFNIQNPLMLRSNLTRTGGSCCCSQINGMADYISVAQCEGFGNMGRCCDSCFRFCNQVSLCTRRGRVAYVR